MTKLATDPSPAIPGDDKGSSGAKHIGTEQIGAVTRVLQDMRAGLESHHDLARCASTACYSPYHFHRLFGSVTGTTPGRFLAALRMQAAKVELAGTEKSVATVCFEVGYGSLGTFTSQFTRLVGLSPGNFRRLVDTAASRTIGEITANSSPPGGGEASVELEGVGESHVAVVGLFGSDIPQGVPASFLTLRGECRGQLSRQSPCQENQLFAVAYPGFTSLVDMALGQMKDVLVGHRTFIPSRSGPPPREPIAENATIRVPMGPPLPVHPPIVSCSAAIHMLAPWGA